MPSATTSDLHDRLLALKPDGLSFNAWALKAGVNRTIFNDVKKRGNIRHDSLTKLLDAIGVSLGDFAAGGAVVRSEVRSAGMSAHDVERSWHAPSPSQPVPLMGTAFGGEWEDGIEMVELHLGEALDYLGRPPSLAADPKAYAVEIVGDSMAPRFEPGERAFVSPKSAVRPGDDVIVQLRAKANDEADQTDGQVVMVLIKRLGRQAPRHVELIQFNPPMTFTVPIERVAAVHRVRGRL